jgi:hypothetical protein
LDALKDEPTGDETRRVAEVDASHYFNNKTILPFSQMELIEVWKDFVKKIDAPQLKSALSAREPSLGDNWQILYELDTELQFNRLTFDLKPKLLGYLRSRLNNEAIEIHFTISDCMGQQPHIPFTDSERWDLLVEKYPALAILRSKFGLDFEHY